MNDDLFLKDHWIMYFRYDRQKSKVFKKDLLSDFFTAKKELNNTLQIETINKYVLNLQKSIVAWFNINCPEESSLAGLFTGSKKFIGDERVESVTSRADLREKLLGRKSGGVFLTTIQKFSEDIELLTDRDNVVCISDEAHRTQTNLDQKITAYSQWRRMCKAVPL